MTEIVSEDVTEDRLLQSIFGGIITDSHGVFQHSLIPIKVQQGTPS